MKKVWAQRICIYVLPFCLALCVCGYYLTYSTGLKILGDEYGYWAAGAFFANIDWNDVTAINDYYGWGYGIPLSLILRLHLPARATYQCGIILNALWLYISYLVAMALIKDIQTEWKEETSAILALMLTYGTSVLLYTQYTMVEVFLCMLYWCVAYLEWKVIRDGRIRDIVCLCIFSVFQLAIHLRTISIVAISVVIVFVVTWKKYKNVKANLVLMLFVCGLVALVSIEKNIYLGAHTLNITDFSLSGANTISGQSAKIKYLFTIGGIISFLKNFMGRIFSSSIMSYTLIISAIYQFIKRIINSKFHNISTKEVIFGIYLLNFLSLVAVASVYMIGSVLQRFDVLTYTRYHEFALGPVTVCAVIYLYQDLQEKVNDTYRVLFIIGIILILTKIVTRVQNFDSAISHLFIMDPMNLFWHDHAFEKYACYLSEAVCALAAFGLLYAMIKFLGERGIMVFGFIAVIINMYIMNYAYVDGCLNWSTKVNEQIDQFVEYIDEKGYADELVFPADNNALRIDQIQFLLKDHKISLYTIENISEMQDKVVISSTGYEKNNYLSEAGYIEVYEAASLKLWVRDK